MRRIRTSRSPELESLLFCRQQLGTRDIDLSISVKPLSISIMVVSQTWSGRPKAKEAIQKIGAFIAKLPSALASQGCRRHRINKIVTTSAYRRSASKEVPISPD